VTAATEQPAVIRWEASGPADAPPIVFLHGAILTRTMWRPVVARLTDRYRCITVDLPGHGAAVADAFSIDAAADVVEDVIAREASGRAIVVGLSLGGFVAMAVAARSPSVVRGLVLAGATGEPRGIGRLAVLAYGLLLQLYPEWLIRAVDQGIMRRRWGRGLAADVLAGGYFAMAGGRSVWALAGQRFRDRLRAYGGPILVINGDLDVVFRLTEPRFVAGIPRLTVHHLGGAAHLSSVDRPEEFAAEIAAFAETLDP